MNKIMKRNYLSTALLCIALAIPTKTFAQKIIEATPGSLEKALATLKKAVKKQQEDIIVRMHGGTYTLQKPLPVSYTHLTLPTTAYV